jgi:hypothetical protein
MNPIQAKSIAILRAKAAKPESAFRRNMKSRSCAERRGPKVVA